MEINYLTKIRVDIVTTIIHLASIAKNPGPVAYKLLTTLLYTNWAKISEIIHWLRHFVFPTHVENNLLEFSA